MTSCVLCQLEQLRTVWVVIEHMEKKLANGSCRQLETLAGDVCNAIVTTLNSKSRRNVVEERDISVDISKLLTRVAPPDPSWSEDEMLRYKQLLMILMHRIGSIFRLECWNGDTGFVNEMCWSSGICKVVEMLSLCIVRKLSEAIILENKRAPQVELDEASAVSISVCHECCLTVCSPTLVLCRTLFFNEQ